MHTRYKHFTKNYLTSNSARLPNYPVVSNISNARLLNARAVHNGMETQMGNSFKFLPKADQNNLISYSVEKTKIETEIEHIRAASYY